MKKEDPDADFSSNPYGAMIQRVRLDGSGSVDNVVHQKYADPRAIAIVPPSIAEAREGMFRKYTSDKVGQDGTPMAPLTVKELNKLRKGLENNSDRLQEYPSANTIKALMALNFVGLVVLCGVVGSICLRNDTVPVQHGGGHYRSTELARMQPQAKAQLVPKRPQPPGEQPA